MLNRRSILRNGGLCFLAFLSGCNSINENPPPKAIISQVYVDNIDDKSHTIYVLIHDKESEQPVYLRSKTVEANDLSNDYEIGGGSFERLPTKSGTYEIWIRLEGRGWKSVQIDEYTNIPERISIGISIGYKRTDSDTPAWKVTVSDTEG